MNNSRDLSNDTLLASDSSLQEILAKVAPDALLIDPRILRRVIRLDRRLPGLGLRVPHDKTYTIERTRLLALVDRDELDAKNELAPVIVLLARPGKHAEERKKDREEFLLHYWRLLFHSRVHLEIESRYPEPEERQSLANERRQQLGELAFAELRAVMLQDKLLFDDPSDWDVYSEFAALALECKYFAPEELKYSFPAISNWVAVEKMLNEDVGHAKLYDTTRLISHDDEQRLIRNRTAGFDHPPVSSASNQFTNSRGNSDKWRSQAEQAAKVKNHLKSAICWNLAAQSSLSTDATAQRESSLKELKILVDKLRSCLGQSVSSLDEWITGLKPVLELATTSFWSAEARLLYDLQKICTESESDVRRANLFGWIRSFGREPLTQSMPLTRFVLMVQHIRSAQKRLAKTRLRSSDLIRLSAILDHAIERAQNLLRETIRPLINQQLDQVNLVPENTPERVARNKLVEEMLDHLTEYGSVTSSTFRDSISKSDLKLRDVSERELLLGDQFLLADKGLAKALEGIYRPAPIYMRWSQRLSSLAFGTNFGRFVTMHIALPFGGAFLIVEGVRHTALRFLKNDLPAQAAIESVDEATKTSVVESLPVSGSGGLGYLAAMVLATGLLIHLLMHRPEFRAKFIQLCFMVMKFLRIALVDWPSKLLQIRLIEMLLYSPEFAPLRTYLVKPSVLTGFALFILQPFLPVFEWRNALIIFLLIALFLNSQIGRYADNWFKDLFIRAIEDLRARVFGAIFHWVMDAFQRLLIGLDRILHTLDEWSRFGSRDGQIKKVWKFISGTVWAVITYFVVLVSTLLIEPQINPIKHFPVVTVSHKLLLPLGPFFVGQLSGYIGPAKANTVVWSTIWLVPGIFGFLVWELRGNWRLYAANRPRTLKPKPVGHHGETMTTLLRPTFHSGTVPKLFANLRNAVRNQHEPAGKKLLNRSLAALRNNQRSIQNFIERELIELLTQSETRETTRLELSVQSVQLATNRVLVALANTAIPGSLLSIVWEEYEGKLVAQVQDDLLLATLPPADRQRLAKALNGIFQKTGVDEVTGQLVTFNDQPITWNQWLSLWNNTSQS